MHTNGGENLMENNIYRKGPATCMFVMPVKALRFEGAASVSCVVTAAFLTRIRRDETEQEGAFSGMWSFLKQTTTNSAIQHNT